VLAQEPGALHDLGRISTGGIINVNPPATAYWTEKCSNPSCSCRAEPGEEVEPRAPDTLALRSDLDRLAMRDQQRGVVVP